MHGLWLLHRCRARRGFTLVEMLIVVAILLVLATLVILVFQSQRGGDRLRGMARTAQSTVLGARDRALHAKERRGVRFIRSPNDPSIVNAMAYIQPLPTVSYTSDPVNASIRILRPDLDNDRQGQDATSPQATIIEGKGTAGTDWFSLDQADLIPYPDARVRIPAGASGRWYTLLAQNSGPPYYTVDLGGGVKLLYLAHGYANPATDYPEVVALDENNTSLEFDLGFEIVPYNQPAQFPSGVVIDLDESSANVRSFWWPTPAPAVPPNIDLLFDPTGAVVGAPSGLGALHFLLNDLEDAAANRNPIAPDNRGEKLVLTIFPQTGLVQVSPIDPTDVVNNTTGAAGADGLADDMFRFARQASAAGQ